MDAAWFDRGQGGAKVTVEGANVVVTGESERWTMTPVMALKFAELLMSSAAKAKAAASPEGSQP